jgi:hypothetical protein
VCTPKVYFKFVIENDEESKVNFKTRNMKMRSKTGLCGIDRKGSMTQMLQCDNNASSKIGNKHEEQQLPKGNDPQMHKSQKTEITKV